MSGFRVEATRGDLVESVHYIHAAVTDARGRLVASAGDPDFMTFWRSAAKPIQALPILSDGAARAFALDDEELALACASHSAEPSHLEVADRFLEKLGLGEDALACGPHAPLDPKRAAEVARSGAVLTPRWSNCSGKHAGMLAMALHHGWPLGGYARAGHPVQERIVAEIEEWTGVARDDMRFGVDGCTAMCVALPLRAMALGYARFAHSEDDDARRLRRAMTGHPRLLAGTGRFCTELGLAWPGGVIAKVGAEGVYSAALLESGHGIALKVEDGNAHAAPVALHAVIKQVARALNGRDADPLAALAHREVIPIRNTRGEVTGVLRPAGPLQFSA